MAEIQAFLITLRADGRQILFVMLAADGAINRQGTGSVSNMDDDVHMGRIDPPLLSVALEGCPPELLKMAGKYVSKEKKGVECTLSILFKWTDGKTTGLEFTYGAESIGPPQPIADFVTRAVHATEPWFQKQKAITKK